MPSELLWFFLILFFFIALIKWFRIHIALNGIWFSNDGTISLDAIENFSHLAQSIRQSPFRHHYDLFLWTDVKNLRPETKKTLKQRGIVVKDYRDAFNNDPQSQMTRDWLEKLLALGNNNQRLFFVMASDLFRLYLLLFYYPKKKRFAYACYLDCNDIYLKALPNPQSLAKLKSIAFHFVPFSYNHHDIFLKILGPSQDTHPLLTNDVILTRNDSNDSLFKELISRYHENLKSIGYLNLNFIETLVWTKDTMTILDNDIVKVMIFTTTHMTNILHAVKGDEQIDLLVFDKKNLARKEITEIQDAASFLLFERDYDKGMTCCQHEPSSMNDLSNDMKDPCRAFWYGLLLHRYQLITAEMNP